MTLKSSVLQLLENNRNISLSGEQLAQQLSVSRSAIWKAINTLKKEGYNINAVTNKGYQLSENTDIISIEGISTYLKKDYSSNNLIIYKTVESTNQEAKKQAADGATHGTIIVAEEQTAGRGRLGRSFFSPSKTGIYMSIILRPNTQASDAVRVTTAAAVAICRAIYNLTNYEPQIKWVNDIFIGEKKISGILTEAVTDFESGTVESVIVGIGINFKTQDFPDGIKEVAGSIFSENSTELTRNQLVAEVINQFLDIYQNLNDRKYLDEYKARSFIVGKQIEYFKDNKWFTGTAIEIDNNGALIIQDQSKNIITLRSGEVSIRRKHNDKNQ